MNHYVEIVNYNTERVVDRMGPMDEWKAEKVETGVLINLNYERYYTRIVKEAK